MDRYQRNGILTGEEQQLLFQKRVCVIGCGGLGGYVIEMLVRLGIGYITVVDGDVFDVTNLNRQILCVMETLGKSKAFTAAERIAAINQDIEVNVISTFIHEENAVDIVRNHDVVVDALDSNSTRLVLVDACKRMGIPYVHGAIAGWFGQVSTVFPDDEWFREHLTKTQPKGVEKVIGNPAFTPACIASHQVSQTLKVMLDKPGILRRKMLFIDLLDNDFEILDFS